MLNRGLVRSCPQRWRGLMLLLCICIYQAVGEPPDTRFLSSAQVAALVRNTRKTAPPLPPITASSQTPLTTGVVAGCAVLLILVAALGCAARRKSKQKRADVQQVRNGTLPSWTTRMRSTTEAESAFFRTSSIREDSVSVVAGQRLVSLLDFLESTNAEAGRAVQLAALAGSSIAEFDRDHSGRTPSYHSTTAALQGAPHSPFLPAVELQVVLDALNEPMKLGVGCYGQVYRGLLRGMTAVALKFPQTTSPGDNDHVKAQLEREIKALQGTHDPHIVRFFGAVQSGQQTILVTEFLPGGDLASALAGPAKDEFKWEARGQYIAYQILQALVYLHANNRAHVDLNPKNVLLDETQTTAKVVDCGVSVFNSATLGTLETAYAAPENSLDSQATTSADIYSFGVMMWEFMTGERPKLGALSVERLKLQYDPALLSLLESCLSHDPSVRPTARQAAVTLAQIIAATPSSSMPVSAFALPRFALPWPQPHGPVEGPAGLERSGSTKSGISQASLRQMVLERAASQHAPEEVPSPFATAAGFASPFANDN